jgi:ectoine hydroxylase-related dioxygenase (phytanoyl-CoA dioxygenase family)
MPVSHLNQLNFYGYCVYKKLITSESINEILDIAKYQFILKEKKLKKYHSNFWDTNETHREILNMRIKNPQLFSLVYDSVYNSSGLHNFMTQRTIVNAASELLDCKQEELSALGYMFRMDPPHDSRNSLDWHQDLPYYPASSDLGNGLVCWVPMQKTDDKNGAIHIVEGSHNYGEMPYERANIKNNISEQLRVNLEKIDHLNKIQLDVDLGDVVFFKLTTVHKSGLNLGERFRFSAGSRFYRMDSTFLPPKNIRYDWRNN